MIVDYLIDHSGATRNQRRFFPSNNFALPADAFNAVGGYDTDFHKKTAKPPIKNEAANGLKNKRGTLAMARTGEVDSATCQFFINHVDNSFLDHTNNTPDGFGYCVFGKVIDGMDVVDAIAAVKTMTRRGMSDVPRETIEIISVERISEN